MGLAPSDEQLAVRAASGDRRAFETLVHRHAPSLNAFCRRLLGDATEAEDKVQEAFLRAYAQLDRFEPAYRFTSWLMKIAQNLCIDALRARRAWDPLPPEVAAAPRAPLLRAQVAEVEAAAADLPARYRAVLHHKYALGLNATEIARELDMTPENVRVCLHRAIRELRARLQP